jgi:hypothetical protein
MARSGVGSLILIVFVAYLGIAFLRWLLRKISELQDYYKYLDKLKLLERKVTNIDMSSLDNEVLSLTVDARSVFDRIKMNHISTDNSDDASIDKYLAKPKPKKAVNKKDKKFRRRFHRRY